MRPSLESEIAGAGAARFEAVPALLCRAGIASCRRLGELAVGEEDDDGADEAGAFACFVVSEELAEESRDEGAEDAEDGEDGEDGEIAGERFAIALDGSGPVHGYRSLYRTNKEHFNRELSVKE